VRIYRTTTYRNGTLWSERICTSRRQWAQLKQDFGHLGITRMELEFFEIPEHLWVLDQELPEPLTQQESLIRQVQEGKESIDQVRERLDLPSWGLPETSEPVVLTREGPVPLSLYFKEEG